MLQNITISTFVTTISIILTTSLYRSVAFGIFIWYYFTGISNLHQGQLDSYLVFAAFTESVAS